MKRERGVAAGESEEGVVDDTSEDVREVSASTEEFVLMLARFQHPACHATIQTYPTPESKRRKEIRHGVASIGNNRYKLRIAVPAGCVVELLTIADLDAFVSCNPIVRVPVEALMSESIVVWRTGGTERMGGRMFLNDIGNMHVEFKSFELALNYQTTMTRYEFQAAWTQGTVMMDDMTARVRQYLDEWIQLIISEKARQFRIADRSLWPQDTQWIAEGWYDMPMVIWVHCNGRH